MHNQFQSTSNIIQKLIPLKEEDQSNINTDITLLTEEIEKMRLKSIHIKSQIEHTKQEWCKLASQRSMRSTQMKYQEEFKGRGLTTTEVMEEFNKWPIKKQTAFNNKYPIITNEHVETARDCHLQKLANYANSCKQITDLENILQKTLERTENNLMKQPSCFLKNPINL